LFRNAIRSRSATLNQAASIIGTLAALAFSLLIALGLGIAAYAISSETAVTQIQQVRTASRASAELPPASFILFMIFAFIYMLWVTLPLSIGGGNQFDPGRLLMYPISLRKLFALDLASEFTSLASVFAIPSVIAIAIGAGLAVEALGSALLVAALTIFLGIVLAKWLATSIGTLIKKRRARGETILALIGALAGLSGAFVGQLWPFVLEHQHWFRALRWTPSGAVALALSEGLQPGGERDYFIGLLVLAVYTSIFLFATFWVAQRGVLGKGERGRKKAVAPAIAPKDYAGWQLPLVPLDLSAMIEKEARYAMRNAQLLTLALMPLILLATRWINPGEFGQAGSLSADSTERINEFLYYGDGLMATAGVLFVFLILAGIACNSFAFEGNGMRTLILAPVNRAKVLVAKNLVVTVLGFLFSAALLMLNQLFFGDLTWRSLLFVLLSFLLFAVFISLAGNWFSIRFPKPMKFGKRMNLSGVAGLLLLPMIFLMALPPLGAIALGYLSRSLLLEYVTLAGFAALAFLLYIPVVRMQGRSLERLERAVLETVSKDLEI